MKKILLLGTLLLTFSTLVFADAIPLVPTGNIVIVRDILTAQVAIDQPPVLIASLPNQIFVAEVYALDEFKDKPIYGQLENIECKAGTLDGTKTIQTPVKIHWSLCRNAISLPRADAVWPSISSYSYSTVSGNVYKWKIIGHPLADGLDHSKIVVVCHRVGKEFKPY